MRRLLALTVGAVLVLPVPAGQAGDDPVGTTVGGVNGTGATVTNTVTTTTGSQGSSNGTQGSSSSGGRPGVTYEKVVLYGPCIPDVPGNTPYLYVIYERPSNRVVGGGCGDPPPGTPAAPVIDYEALRQQAVSVVASVSPDAPGVSVQPNGRALLNTPVVVHVADPGGPLSDSTENAASGRTITVNLTAPTYRWDFGDGVERTAGPGRAYDDGDVPAEGSGNPYVSHTYRRAGSYTVTVSATYGVSYTVEGLGTFDLQDLVLSGSAPLRVVQSRSELVRD